MQGHGIERRNTRKIHVGKVPIGGDAPIAVQSMLKTNPENIQQTIDQARELKKAGCELIRMALPHEDTCKVIPFLRREVDIPLIGDIHFNHKIALLAMESGIDGIRINPGTINNIRKVREVARVAKETGTPVRIGINVGSIEKRLLKNGAKADANTMVQSALDCIKVFEDEGWTELKVSLKASDILQSVEAHTNFSTVSDYPVHIGITEAGPVFSGVIKSSVGIGILLYQGIGDTIRVSLTGDPVYEVIAAYHILRNLGLRKRGINIISCPTCGRCKTNIQEIVEEFEKEVATIDKHLSVAIMGCEVNGPGEAKDADIGIAFGQNKATLFAKGSILKKGLPKEVAKAVLREEVHNRTI